MAEKTTIKLFDPIKLGGAHTLESVTFRAPTFADFMEFGEPEYFVPVAGGKAGFVETNMDALRNYVERLLDKDTNRSLLEAASLADTLRIRDAVLGFFRDARMKTAPPNMPGSNMREPSDSGTASRAPA